MTVTPSVPSVPPGSPGPAQHAGSGRTPALTPTIREAYKHCEQVTRSQARNFAWGILLLPRVMARHSLQAGHVMVEIEGIDLRRTFSLVSLRASKPSLAVRRFCQHLRQQLSDNL